MKRFLICLVLASSATSFAREPGSKTANVRPTQSDQLESRLQSAVALNPQKTVRLDKPHGRVFLQTTVALREGLLEMFLCKKQTKEHESVLAIDASAQVIHAGLLAAGATPGKPAKFQPQFTPPQGDRIEIW